MQIYLDKLSEFVNKYKGKFIAVSNGKFFGEYKSKFSSWKDMQRRNLQEVEFVIMECLPHKADYNVFWLNCF